MEPKNRLLVTLAVVALIAGAMLVSFGRNLVALNTPRVVLADTSGSGSDTSDGSLSPSNVYQRVEVTPRTVQSVIATLDRSDSYYRELTVESFRFMAGFEGAVPGASEVECGNYRDMDLPAAKAEAAAMLPVLEALTGDELHY